jgi:hypothetical protein
VRVQVRDEDEAEAVEILAASDANGGDETGEGEKPGAGETGAA